MSIIRLLWNNIKFYRKNHLAVILGILLSTSVITGSLMIGDSIRHSLGLLAVQRLGKTMYAFDGNNHFISQDLVEKIRTSTGPVTPDIIKTRGTAIVNGGEQRTNNIQVLAVNKNFWTLWNDNPQIPDLDDDEVIINSNLARKMNLKVNDSLLLMIQKIDFVSYGFAFRNNSDQQFSIYAKIKHIAGDNQGGLFNLKTNQGIDNTVFVSLKQIQKILKLDGYVNTLLAGRANSLKTDQDSIDKLVEKNWTFSDMGLQFIQQDQSSVFYVKSRSIFIDKSIDESINREFPDSSRVLSYFTNRITHNNYFTPYSFISAVTFFPGLLDNEIIINQWLADDLKAGPGDTIQISYYVEGEGDTLVERTNDFIVKTIIPIQQDHISLMPDFPGIADAASCREWEPGVLINLDDIRKKDEDYWNTYKGTPKAYINLKKGQTIWANRFGTLTAVIIDENQYSIQSVKTKLSKVILPVTQGIVFRPVLELSQKAVEKSIDFTGLFLSLSFFIIISALMLAGMFFILMIEQRRSEIGLYKAVGFPNNLIRRIFLAEGMLLSIAGAIPGVALGIIYNNVLLYGLKTLWIDAAGISSLTAHVSSLSLTTGLLSGIICGIITIYFFSKKILVTNPGKLQRSRTRSDSKKGVLSFVLSALSFLSLIIIIFLGWTSSTGLQVIFFSIAGTLVLCGSLFLTNGLLCIGKTRPGITNFLITNPSHNKKFSLLTIGILASAVFIIVAVGANRLLPPDLDDVKSPAGGFEFIAETTIPVLKNINTIESRNLFDLSASQWDGANFVSMRLLEGDEASCLNIHQALTPSLVGLDPRVLYERQAFTFTDAVKGFDRKINWLNLENIIEPEIIPGFADQTVISWSLGLKLGGTINYTDESGKTFKVKLIGALNNTIFQGRIIISEKNFINRFPSTAGYRLFLVDTPGKDYNSLKESLASSFENYGIDITGTREEILSFYAVENTYLSIFLMLGGLGIAAGTFGLGIIVLRKLSESKKQTAMLLALGFDKKLILKLVMQENLFLVVPGIIIGLTAGFISILPVIRTGLSQVPFALILVLTGAVFVNSLIVIRILSAMALKGNLLKDLQEE